MSINIESKITSIIAMPRIVFALNKSDLLTTNEIEEKIEILNLKDYKKALEYAKIALTQASDDINKKSIEAAIKSLEAGKAL